MNELKSYLRPSYSFLLAGIFLALVALSALGAGFVALLFLAGSAVLLWIGISDIKEFKAEIDKHSASGRMDYIISDFSSATPMIGNNIRVGRSYLFGKRSGRILSYDEIRQVYQHIHKTNGAEDRRELRYVDSTGKTCTLCQLKLKDKSKDELIQILTIILQHNPNVKIGYK